MSESASASAQNLPWYQRLIAPTPEVELKGASMRYTSYNGHMFSFLTKEGTLALRLPAEELEAFLKKHKTTLCEQHGRVMKEYAVVPDRLLKKTQELRPYFEMSLAYVGSLKPKPTTKKKAAKKKRAKKSPKR